jgi:hypothetical protein
MLHRYVLLHGINSVYAVDADAVDINVDDIDAVNIDADDICADADDG